MTGPVSPPSPADRAWADLGAELTPAKSLARVDAVTARAITTITVVGVLLTGLGAVTAGLLTQDGAARVLAAVTVLTAAAAVACALAAQVLTITRHLNPADLTQVQAWYRRQFRTRAYPTQAATLLLLAAAILAGATPGPGGNATVTLTISLLTSAQPVTVTARAPHQTCQATLVPARIPPVLTCHSH